jgi:hypothetical protein
MIAITLGSKIIIIFCLREIEQEDCYSGKRSPEVGKV